jgi:hypothetical protein
MKILIACEFSGTVRRAFAKRGYDAWSCDLLPSDDNSPNHIQGNVLGILDRDWDLMVAHPPCTHLAVSGAAWFKHKAAEQADALAFVRQLLNAPIPKIALENPVSIISSRIRKPDQIIQPYEFGDDASKKTCLWLKGLPKLYPTSRIPGRLVKTPSGKIVERWANQCDNYGHDKQPPSADRWKIRSKTYDGIASAMADQWGNFSTAQGRTTTAFFLT